MTYLTDSLAERITRRMIVLSKYRIRCRTYWRLSDRIARLKAQHP